MPDPAQPPQPPPTPGTAAARRSRRAPPRRAAVARLHRRGRCRVREEQGLEGPAGRRQVLSRRREADRPRPEHAARAAARRRSRRPAHGAGRSSAAREGRRLRARRAEGRAPNAPFQTWAKTRSTRSACCRRRRRSSRRYNKFLAEQSTALETDYKTKVTADKQALLKEWGAGHERMMNVAQGAAKALGFSGEMIDALEQTVGYAATMKFFSSSARR
jgi:hypothetical protein